MHGTESLLAYALEADADFDGTSALDRALHFDATVLLPFCYNVKVDVATMMSSLEARCPFQDREVVEWAAQIPSVLLMKPWETKASVEACGRRWLPREVVYRPKRGFSLPIDEWFRGPWARRQRADSFQSRRAIAVSSTTRISSASGARMPMAPLAMDTASGRFSGSRRGSRCCRGRRVACGRTRDRNAPGLDLRFPAADPISTRSMLTVQPAVRSRLPKVALYEPSGHGGIAHYTFELAEGLHQAGWPRNGADGRRL
jgi:hypothetical protein